MFTRGLWQIHPEELEDTGVKVNTDDPDYTATDLNAHLGYLTVAR